MAVSCDFEICGEGFVCSDVQTTLHGRYSTRVGQEQGRMLCSVTSSWCVCLSLSQLLIVPLRSLAVVLIDGDDDVVMMVRR